MDDSVTIVTAGHLMLKLEWYKVTLQHTQMYYCIGCMDPDIYFKFENKIFIY